MGDVSGWRVVHGREADIGSEVDVRQLLEQLGSAALGDPCGAVDDQVFEQAIRVARRVSIDSATRLSLRMLRILRCSGRCAATISSPSRPTHTRVTWGCRQAPRSQDEPGQAIQARLAHYRGSTSWHDVSGPPPHVRRRPGGWAWAAVLRAGFTGGTFSTARGAGRGATLIVAPSSDAEGRCGQ